MRHQLNTKLIQALADDVRWEMIEIIAKKGRISCKEITDKFHLSQPTISHHLKLLLNAKLINVSKEGQFHYFSVNSEVLKIFVSSVSNLIKGGRKR